MKTEKLLVLFICANALICSCAEAPDYSRLTSDYHPRLALDDGDFDKVRSIVEAAQNGPVSSADSCILRMHLIEMETADASEANMTPLRYNKDASGRRILHICMEAVTRIWSNAYAYRFTGDPKYLRHAELDINAVCDFPDWNPSHYLDVAEMCNAVAFGYDWLYDSLADSTKAKALHAIKNFAFGTAPGKSFYQSNNNWNQVCNGGLISGALACYESFPELAREIIDSSVVSNKATMSFLYAPDGIYKEGPAYWMYGSNYEALLLSFLDGCLGTDFGISGSEGFGRTGYFIAACKGNTGLSYNYADNSASLGVMPALWYLADRFDDPFIARMDLDLITDLTCGSTSGTANYGRYTAMMPVAMKHALRIKDRLCTRGDAEAPTTFFGQGESPIAIVRTGFGQNDLYLAAKGGGTRANHSHMDAGSFIFEAQGIRWAVELGAVHYAPIEAGLKTINADLWDRKNQDSKRWCLFRYANAQHNTISISGKQHLVNQCAPMTGIFNDTDKLGASFDLTSTLGPELSKAVRTLLIRDGAYLEVTDTLSASKTPAADSAGADVPIRWTLVTMAEPQITPDGIILRQEGHTLLLSCTCNDCKDCDGIRYTIWSSDPKDYDSPTAFCEPKESAHICGFEAIVPAGKTSVFVTTLTPGPTSSPAK